MKIIQDHNSYEYLEARSKLKLGKHNGAYYYSKEIVENFIPKIKTDLNWQTINHQTAPDNCIVFVHSNNALHRYDYLLNYKNVVLVCSTNHSKDKLISKGHRQVIYVPLSIDTEYLDKFKSETKSGEIACGNIWAFTDETKKYFRDNNIIHYHDLQRDELLTLMGKSKRVYAIGRTAMEAIYLGAEVIQPDKEYPVEKYDTYYTQDDAIRIMQEQLDNLKEVVMPIKNIKIVVGIATMKGREKQLEQAIKSLERQVDEIVIYDNSNLKDRADNGKFFPLRLYKEPIYFLSCDDDLIYPPDYAISMIDAIERHKCIVAHHGRILKGKDLSYYIGHETVRFNSYNNSIKELDVVGTGVCGFDTEYFNPVDLCDHKELRMSDIIFSLEAKKQGKKMLSLPHNTNWIKQCDLKGGYSICATEIKNEERQIKYANKIWQLKNSK